MRATATAMAMMTAMMMAVILAMMMALLMDIGGYGDRCADCFDGFYDGYDAFLDCIACWNQNVQRPTKKQNGNHAGQENLQAKGSKFWKPWDKNAT